MAAGYLVPVDVKVCPDPAKGSAKQITADLAGMAHDDAHVLLRQSFVAPSNAEALCINPTDNGRFTNHSAVPNVGACVDHSNDSYALQDIAEGDELTCDYSGFVTPEWWGFFELAAIPLYEGLTYAFEDMVLMLNVAKDHVLGYSTQKRCS
ncbi:hypothetical protein WJX74_004365 [Apatococcus lobatus]|uniref:SET domain-containing protein n=1 Tax=Apatococcus lobatus TaxID=904363 RepID=A0AAW1Q2L4_9CHLO